MATTFPIFNLAKMVAGSKELDPVYCWIIIETFMTSDGQRTRVCGRMRSEEEARAEYEKRVNKP